MDRFEVESNAKLVGSDARGDHWLSVKKFPFLQTDDWWFKNGTLTASNTYFDIPGHSPVSGYGMSNSTFRLHDDDRPDRLRPPGLARDVRKVQRVRRRRRVPDVAVHAVSVQQVFFARRSCVHTSAFTPAIGPRSSQFARSSMFAATLLRLRARARADAGTQERGAANVRRRCARSTSIRMCYSASVGRPPAPPHSHSRRTTARRRRARRCRRSPHRRRRHPPAPCRRGPHPSPSPGGPPRAAAAASTDRLPAAGARAVVRAGRRHDGAASHGRTPAAAAEAGDRVHAADVDLSVTTSKASDFDAFWRTMQGKEKWPSLGGGGGYHRMAGRWPPPGAAAVVEEAAPAAAAAGRRAGRRRGAASAEARPGGAGAHRAVGDAIVPVGGDAGRRRRSSRGTTRESASPPARRRRRRRRAAYAKRSRPPARRDCCRRRRRSRPPSRSSRGTTAGSGCEESGPSVFAH